MSISESADMVQAQPTPLLDHAGRLPPGTALMAIAGLSAAAWTAIVMAALGLWQALQ